MRRRRIQTVFYTIALLWAALASEPMIAQADAVPAISSLSPISVSTGSGGLTLTINGGGFDSSAQVKFNGDVLTPASVTSTRITAIVPAADVECGGYVGVTVTTTSGESTFKLFTIENQAPQIFGLTPTMAFSGGSFFTLTLVGSGFNSQTQVLFGPDKLTPDTASPTQLTVTVPAGEIAFPGTFSISAFNPDPVTGTPNTQTFTVVRPYPIISSVSPNTIPAGTPDLSVTITGLNFTNASTVQWNDPSLTTTFVSATSLKAVIPAASLAAMTTANITVSDTDYGVSAPVPFVVTAPIPMASALNPASANSGDPDFTLTINGASFQAGSVVKWGNTALATTFVSSSQLTVTIPAGYVWTPATVPVTVTTLMGGKTMTTAPLTFTVNSGAPTITSLSPDTKVAGSPTFTLTVMGSRCLKGATINWNGTPLATTIVSSSMLTADISDDKIATMGTAAVTLSNVGSSPSSALTFTIAPRPGPQISALSPSTVEAGTPDTVLTVTGANFTSGCVVQWNGDTLPTTFVSTTSLTATIPAANLAAITTADITVLDPDFGVSPKAPFKVTATTPTAMELVPSSASSGDPDFTLAVNGTNFQAGSVINWSSIPLATTFVSSSQLTAIVPASLVWTTATIPVTITTPMNGKASTSTPLIFTVNPSTPTITALSPAFKLVNSPAFTLTVTGAKCLKGATINWNGTPLATTVVSSSMLTAPVSADLISAVGTAAITLSNAGSSPSNPLTFTILPRIAPTITSLSPSSVPAKSDATRLVVTGTGFTRASTVCWNGSALSTTFAGETSLVAIIPAINLTDIGSANVTVSDVEMGVSDPAIFTITAPPPTTFMLNPDSANSGDPDFTLTVGGADFQAGSVIRWGNMTLATTVVSPIQLTATIPASYIWTPTTIPVTVATPMNGKASTSTPLIFTVNPGTPTITALSPASKLVNSSAFTLTVTGARCLKGATINWNGTPLATTVVSSSMLTAPVSADLISAVGLVTITLANAGGSPSNPLTFTILPRIAPTITNLSPGSVPAQSAATRLVVTGTGFTRASIVQWNGNALATGYASATSLVVTIPAANLANPGAADITVFDPDMGVSDPATFTITAPPPTIISLSPSAASSGDPSFTLTVNGADFQTGSVIRWGNTALATTFVSPTQLTATIPANYVWTPITIPVTVSTPMNGKTSTTTALTFTVNPGTPTITALSPASKLVNSSAFTLTVTGARCLKGATINWNGTPLATTVVSSSMLTAPVSADLISAVGLVTITLANAGGSPSNPLTFTILPRIAPTITNLSPGSVPAQSAATRLVVTGTGFTRASIVQWNGNALATGYASATSLVATIPAANLANPGSADVTVSEPEMGVSTPATFTITAPPPTAISLSPGSVNSGDPDFTLSVNGADFQSGSVIRWGNIPLATTFVSSSKLTTTVPANYIWTPTTVPITVGTVMSGRTVATAALTFTVNMGTPTIKSLAPASATAGGASFTLTVTGAKCLKGAAINWNGTPLATTFVSSSMLTAVISADMITTAGSATITLTNTGSSTPSSPLTFQILAPPTPKIGALAPSTAPANSSGLAVANMTGSAQGLTLSVTGANFTSASVIRWNGATLPTTFVSAASLKATIPASYLKTAGTASVTVADPKYGVSGAAPFVVTAPTPLVFSLSPSAVSSGDPNFTLTVNGADFQSGSVIKWGNTPLATTFVSPTQLTAAIPAAYVWTPTTIPVTVTTIIGGKAVTSGSQTFTVNPATPTIATLSPASKAAGSASFTLTVTGSKCLKGSTINWNGTPLATTIVSSSLLTATVSADLLVNIGTASVTLSNAGSAPSRPLVFTITAPALTTAVKK